MILTQEPFGGESRILLREAGVGSVSDARIALLPTSRVQALRVVALWHGSC